MVMMGPKSKGRKGYCVGPETTRRAAPSLRRIEDGICYKERLGMIPGMHSRGAGTLTGMTPQGGLAGFLSELPQTAQGVACRDVYRGCGRSVR